MASTGVGGGGGVGKLIIKSGTKLSLHERFSQLAHVVDETPPPPPPAAPVVTAVSSHHQHHHHHPAVHRIPPSSSVLRSSQSFYDPPPVYSRYDSTGGSHPQAGSSSFLSRTPPSAQTSYSSSSYNYDHHPLQRNSLDYETALEYKRNSLMNRLGRRPTTNPQYGHYGPYYRPQGKLDRHLTHLKAPCYCGA